MNEVVHRLPTVAPTADPVGFGDVAGDVLSRRREVSDTPASARASAGATAIEIERTVEAMRARVRELYKAAEEAERETERLIEDMTRRNLALQEQVERDMRRAKALTECVRQAIEAAA